MARTESLRVAIIGAGPAGLAAGAELARNRINVEIFERSSQVGGLAKSVSFAGHNVELGPHLIAAGDPDALALWREIRGETRPVTLKRGMLRRGRVVPYPPTPLGMLRAFTLMENLRGVAGLVATRLRRAPDSSSAQDWFVARYGWPVYRYTVRPYLKKLWGTDGHEIDASYLGTVSASAAEQSRTATFEYPVDGMGGAWRRLRDRLSPFGSVSLERSIDGVIVRGGRIAGLCVQGEIQEFTHLLSTAPLSTLLRLLPSTPPVAREAAGRLRARHIVSVHLYGVMSPPLRHAWIFIEDPALSICRVTDGRTWGMRDLRNASVTTIEFWCGDDDAVWRESDRATVERAKRELAQTSLFAEAVVEQAQVTRLPAVLPMPFLGYRNDVETIQRSIAEVRGLHTLGRHGTFALDSTISSMGAGIAVARGVLRDSELR